jgi:hypothetical protein
VGAAGQVRPRRSDSDEEAHRTPHGKRASWSGNQLTVLVSNKNTAFFNIPYFIQRSPVHLKQMGLSTFVKFNWAIPSNKIGNEITGN